MVKQRNYILFLDESGKSKLSDDGHDHFLLSGLIIDEDLHAALSSYMISLKEKSKIPFDHNIHAFDLFEAERMKVIDSNSRVMKSTDGSTKHKRIPYSSINTFFNRLVSLIEGADMRCFVLRIDKKPYHELIIRTAQRENVLTRPVTKFLRRRQLNDFLYESLARKLILEFGRYLEKENAYGHIVAESRRQEDETVLKAFIAATHESTYPEKSHFRTWAKNSFKRIHSLTFQNKKGLSFGLEIADLFGWAHFNKHYGRMFPIDSRAKIQRVEDRIKRTCDRISMLSKTGPEDMTQFKIRRISPDRVSELTEALKEYRGPTVFSGTTPGNPGGP